jgi:hypothetical protein
VTDDGTTYDNRVWFGRIARTQLAAQPQSNRHPVMVESARLRSTPTRAAASYGHAMAPAALPPRADRRALVQWAADRSAPRSLACGRRAWRHQA